MKRLKRRAPHVALLMLAFLLVAGACSTSDSRTDPGRGANSTNRGVASGSEADYELLKVVAEEVVGKSSLRITDRIQEIRGGKCGAGAFDERGKQGRLTLALEGSTVETQQVALQSLLPGLKAANEQHFGGRGSVEDSSSSSGPLVALRADGLQVMISSGGGSAFTLDGSGPCRE